MQKLPVFIIISLLFFQLIFSFLFPSCGFSDSWQPVSQYLPKFDQLSDDNFFLAKLYPLISEDYRLNSDIGHYLELARNFSPEYFSGSPFLERPLYSFLIFAVSLPLRLFTEASYGLIFALAIAINLALMIIGVLMFFSILERLFSRKVAWISSILLIFSPFVHNYLNQPLAEALMAFSVVLSAYLLVNYVQRPSNARLVVFSFIIGVLMLGKMFFAISIFFLILAIFKRRYREGAIFFSVHLIPFVLWYFFITKIWGISYYSHQVGDWQMGIWVFQMFSWSWAEIYRTLFNVLPDFINALFFSFLLLPVIFSVIGMKELPSKNRNVIYFGALFSVMILGFMAKFFYFRHVFLLFPIIYPTAALGMIKIAEILGKKRRCFSPAFYAIVIGLIIAISNINIYRVFDYNNG
jgi:4-amino-4-deoxy-L-arabinose transferase-like glycosyltransferase